MVSNMKYLANVLFAVILVSSVSIAQPEGSDKYYLGAGAAFPSAPQFFYDYWDLGFVLGAGYLTTVAPSTELLLSMDFSRFSLNKNRFFKGIELDQTGNSIAGGAISLITTSAQAKHTPKNQEYVIFHFLGGLGFSFSSIAESNATFSGQPVHQDSQSSFWGFLSLGGGLEFALRNGSILSIDGRAQFPFISSRKANATNSSIRIGIIRPI